MLQCRYCAKKLSGKHYVGYIKGKRYEFCSVPHAIISARLFGKFEADDPKYKLTTASANAKGGITT